MITWTGDEGKCADLRWLLSGARLLTGGLDMKFEEKGNLDFC